MSDAMTDTIPQDILERAREIAKDWIYNAKETDQLDDFIAQALLAERKAQREKDAGIAAEHTPVWVDRRDRYRWSQTADTLAQAIRNQP